MAAKKKSAKTSDVAAIVAAVTDEQAQHPNLPVPVLVADARRMGRFAAPLETKMLKLPGVAAGLLGELTALASGLQDSNDAWQISRKDALGGGREKARAQLSALRTRAMKTLKFLWRRNAKALARLEVISEGDGSLADLLGDAAALAKELSTAPEAARLDSKLVGAETKLVTLADALSDAPTQADGEALRLRDRYAWALSEHLDEVEAVLDFLLRDTPEKRKQYARTRRHVKKPHKPAPASTPG